MKVKAVSHDIHFVNLHKNDSPRITSGSHLLDVSNILYSSGQPRWEFGKIADNGNIQIYLI